MSELQADVKARDKDDQTALHYAAREGHKCVVSVLINEFGCSPDSKGLGDMTPLHAACLGGQVEMVKELINKYKYDSIARNEDGSTPLHIAATYAGPYLAFYIWGGKLAAGGS